MTPIIVVTDIRSPILICTYYQESDLYSNRHQIRKGYLTPVELAGTV